MKFPYQLFDEVQNKFLAESVTIEPLRKLVAAILTLRGVSVDSTWDYSSSSSSVLTLKEHLWLVPL